MSVVDRISWCPLFDKVIDWKKSQHAPHAAASLIQFFFKFSDQMNGGDVKKVSFGEAVEESRASHSAGMYRGGKKSKQGTRAGITMFTACSPECIVAIFLSEDKGSQSNDEKGPSICSQILQLFMTRYEQTLLPQLKSQFESEAKNPEQALLNENFLSHFKDFDGALLALFAERGVEMSTGELRDALGRESYSVSARSLTTQTSLTVEP